jgi:hypothetical protein
MSMMFSKVASDPESLKQLITVFHEASAVQQQASQVGMNMNMGMNAMNVSVNPWGQHQQAAAGMTMQPFGAMPAVFGDKTGAKLSFMAPHGGQIILRSTCDMDQLDT